MGKCGENELDHGGNIYWAAKRFGLNPLHILDYSANINPLGIPDIMKKAFISSIGNAVHYPDPDCSELKEEISRYLSIPIENIIIGNGASEVIFLLFKTLNLNKILIPSPTFSEYCNAAEDAGVEVDYFLLMEKDEFKLDADLLINRSHGCDAIMLCNPNNPTSTMVNREDLLKILHFAFEKSMVLIVDEAFIELTKEGNENSLIDQIENYHNLFIIRAFTKVFSIPGVRLGYGLGEAGLIKKMWRQKMPWSVNSFALSIGKVLPELKEYLSDTSGWLKEELHWFYDELTKIKELKVFKPETNFILIKILCDRFDASRLFKALAARGIIIRDASNFKTLNNKFFRIAVKDRNSNVKFLAIIKETIKHLVE
ncbi:MAG: threonine-phosphate decarboxylase CobD [Clostridia bacterium]|nr:threonine-phosphate decarboxylase CobD [Clostridia bacterium]